MACWPSRYYFTREPTCDTAVKKERRNYQVQQYQANGQHKRPPGKVTS